jgi:hypothetical protein
VLKGATVQGWPAGHALDVEETLAFSELHGVKAYVEKFPQNWQVSPTTVGRQSLNADDTHAQLHVAQGN